MHPELLHLGPLTIPTYGFALVAAFFAALWLLRRRAPANGIDGELAFDMGIWLILSGLFGAKLLLVIVEWPTYVRSFKGLLDLARAGGVFYGGLVGALVAAVFFIRKKGVPFLGFADAAAPAIALGQAIGRLGCLAAGCCWGASCSHPWAITFTDPKAEASVGVPLGVPLHPTQIYEAVGLFVLVGLLVGFEKRRFPGQTFGLYLVSAAALRFTVELVRGDPRGSVLGLLSTSQFIAIVLFLLGLGILLTGRRRAAAPAA